VKFDESHKTKLIFSVKSDFYFPLQLGADSIPTWS